MADPAEQLLADRAMRNAARGLVESDIAFIRENMATRSLPARLADRVTGGARDIASEAAVAVDENRVALSTSLVIGGLGIAAYLFRKPLKAGLESVLQRWNPKRD